MSRWLGQGAGEGGDGDGEWRVLPEKEAKKAKAEINTVSL